MTLSTTSRMTLSGAITESLRLGEMSSSLETALLTKDRNRVIHKDETEYWDYKGGIDLNNPLDIASLSKWILGFHNAKGGAIFVGISNDYRVVGIHESRLVDTVRLRDKIKKYTGSNIGIFQNRIPTQHHGKVIWAIFIPKRVSNPVASLDSSIDRDGKFIIQKDSYYIRVFDEVRRCISPNDYEYLFGGTSFKHLNAYLYEIDEPYFRILSPHHDQFIGRNALIDQVVKDLESRSYIISLDGVGGVGKSALAIELTRKLYQARVYNFIISLSAKNRVWHMHTEARQAGFSGFTELIVEMARVLDINTFNRSVDKIKRDVIQFMRGEKGLILIDNIEEIKDTSVFEFLKNEIPDPVKILITSRINRDLGARTISVPEMTIEEASSLLYHDLDKFGYHKYITESEAVQEIIKATGRLPLAIKWAASLATKGNSLQQVASKLKRSDDTTKRELLDFCFTTMYDELPDLAREAAMLCPYLGSDWNALTLSIALDKPMGQIEKVINELEDRGIISSSKTSVEGTFTVLPLTMDFLSQKWHQNKILRDTVENRVWNIIASTSREGNLFSLSKEKRVQALYDRAIQLVEEAKYDEALNHVRLALEWSPKESSPIRVKFLEGRIIYESLDKRDGINMMQSALDDREASSLHDEHILLAQALLSYGTTGEQEIAIRNVIDHISYSQVASKAIVEDICQKSMRQQNYRLLTTILDKIKYPKYAYWIVLWLMPHLHNQQLVFTLGESILKGLQLACNYQEVTESEVETFQRKLLEIKKSFKTKSNT